MSQYTRIERKTLLNLAKQSIEYGLQHQKIMTVKTNDYPESLQEERACFVTLTINNQLRGCIGSLEAHQPLVQDVIYNAYHAAFSDPRFQPMSEEDLVTLSIHISILTKPEAIHFTSEEDLLNQIQPDIDGLILSEGGLRGTFLPSVWEQLPHKKEFLNHLKLKAGLPENYWSDTIKIERYHTDIIE